MKKLVIFFVAFMCVSFTMNAQVNLQEGLVAYYPFNGNANDESGNENHGTIFGSPSSIPGIYDESYNFNNQGDYIKIPDSDNLDTDYEMSISLWIKPELTNVSAKIVSKWYSSPWNGCTSCGTGDYIVQIGANENNKLILSFIVANYELYGDDDGSDAVKTPEGLINEGTWYHVIGVFNNGYLKLFVNGELVDQKESAIEYTSLEEYSTDQITVGQNWNLYTSYQYFGAVDDLRIYNRELNQDEIKSLYYGIAVKPQTTKTNVGQTIDLTVENTIPINTADNIISYQFDLAYDNTKLEYVNADLTGTIAENGSIDVNTNSASSLSVSYMTSTALSGTGNLLNLKFKAIDSGISDLIISDFLFNTDTVYNVTNGQVTAEYLYGDVDANDYVQAYDAALTLQHSVGLDPLPEIDELPWDNWREKVADVDGVAGITANDAAEILKYSTGKITQFPVESKKKSGQNEDADVIIAIENNEIVFKANGELFGLNVSTNATGLGEPNVLDNNMLSATNITETNYAVGICTAYAPTEGSTFMKIPFTTKESVTFDLIVNTQIKSVTVDLTTGIAKIDNQAIQIFPNPAKDKLTISGLTNKSELSIYSLSGKLLKQQTVDNGNVNISDLSKGVYVVKIRNNDNILTTQRIVKQ